MPLKTRAKINIATALFAIPVLCLILNRYEIRRRHDAFVQAVAAGNVSEVKALLTEGADPNARVNDDNPRTKQDASYNVLYLAATQLFRDSQSQRKFRDTIVLLVNAGANARTPGVMGSALESRSRDLVALLLAHGATFSAVDLVPALWYGDPDIVQTILEHGGSANGTGRGETPLQSALQLFGSDPDSRRTQLLMVTILLSHGADPNLVPPTAGLTMGPQSALARAVALTNRPMIRLLLAHDARVDVRDFTGQTPLMYAHDVETVAFLLARGADVNACDRQGRTPLMWADDSRAAAMIVRRGANINALDYVGRTALDHAEQRRYAEVIQLLRSLHARHGVPPAGISRRATTAPQLMSQQH